MFQRDSLQRRNSMSVFPESAVKDVAVAVSADVALLCALHALLLKPSRQLCDTYVCHPCFLVQAGKEPQERGDPAGQRGWWEPRGDPSPSPRECHGLRTPRVYPSWSLHLGSWRLGCAWFSSVASLNPWHRHSQGTQCICQAVF